jgi:hypothetical protein
LFGVVKLKEKKMTKKKAVQENTQTQKVGLSQAAKRYNVTLTFISPILGSAPSNKEVYQNYVASQMPEPTPELVATEVAQIPDLPKTGKTIFRVDPDTQHLIYLPHQIRGFLKAAASAITGKELSAFKSKIDKFVFVAPDVIELKLDGQPIKADPAMDTEERPLQAMTAQGPRVSLLSSEKLKKGVKIDFQLIVLPLGQREITEELLRSWFEYGEFQGISQWRNGGYGRFTFELTPVTRQFEQVA